MSDQPLLPRLSAPFKVATTPPLKILANPFSWLLWGLDVTVWLVTVVGPLSWITTLLKGPKRGVKINDFIRHESHTKKLLEVTFEGENCNTAYDLAKRAFEKYADKPACGTRKYLGTHQVDGMRFPLQKFGATIWTTYREFGEQVNRFGAGLLMLGLQPAPANVDIQTTSGPHTILIYEETSQPWMTAALGAFTQSISVATSYATLGISAVVEAVNETGAKAIVCNIKDIEKVTKACETQCPSLQALIYTTNYSTETTPKAVASRLKIVSVQQVIDMSGNVVPAPPTADHLAVIMYTSGSTGKPKGVMIKHKAINATIATLSDKYPSFGLKEGQENYCAYLPAAHIFELVAQMSMFFTGQKVGFADPKTISSKGACRERDDGSINKSPGLKFAAGGIQEFRPSIFIAVPKIWDILKKGVEEAMGNGSAVTKYLFQVAFSGRYCALKQGRESYLFKKVVFKKLHQMLGGNMKCGITGGGAISAELQSFIRVAFAIPLVGGYGLTETCAMGTLQDAADFRDCVVGPPMGSMELKLRSCLDAKGEPEIVDRNLKPYLATDKYHYHLPCSGRGEVLLKGHSVTSGYFKQQDKWNAVFQDNCFYTGDVGVLARDGALIIVDRVKNLIKLKGGEYIAIEAMEKEYGGCAFVNGQTGGIMCYGDGDMDRPVALVQANLPPLEKWAKQAGIIYSTPEDLCSKKEVVKMVLDNLIAAGKAGQLGANEILCAIALIPGTGSMTDLSITSPWTPENAGLTASNKLNRQPIQKACGALLDPLKQQAAR